MQITFIAYNITHIGGKKKGRERALYVLRSVFYVIYFFRTFTDCSGFYYWQFYNELCAIGQIIFDPYLPVMLEDD